MKRIVSLFLALVMILSLCIGCGKQDAAPTQTADPGTTAAVTAETTVPAETTPWLTGPEALQGKKIIFIGNSYSFCGQAVLTIQNDILRMDLRQNDQGIFYQLCKANGIDVSVTNWTYGSHSMRDFFQRRCEAGRECQGVDHEMHLTDRYYDYVVLQCHNEKEYNGDFMAYLSYAMEFFREANPNVKFLMHVPHMSYHKKSPAWLADLDQLVEGGVRIANWGELCHDVLQGNVEVPGATQEYTYHTFVINWREDDGFHQNVLCGYLTSLMVYCAITGESAVGQPWKFTNDPTLHPNMDWEKMKALHYSYGPETNFVEVFKSDADMLGLQQLADLYLEKYNGAK